jgi:hypothetical protein
MDHVIVYSNSDTILKTNFHYIFKTVHLFYECLMYLNL